MRGLKLAVYFAAVMLIAPRSYAATILQPITDNCFAATCNAQITPFDASLGVLHSVTISEDTEYHINRGVLDFRNPPVDPLQLTEQFHLSVSGLIISDYPAVIFTNDDASLTYDFSFIADGSREDYFSNYLYINHSTTIFMASADLAAFTATPAISYEIDGNDIQSWPTYDPIGQGFEEGVGVDDGNLTASLLVTYSYSVPEPASWLLMILGFGSIGATFRRRRASLDRLAKA